jgi:hypothetical protein
MHITQFRMTNIGRFKMLEVPVNQHPNLTKCQR